MSWELKEVPYEMVNSNPGTNSTLWSKKMPCFAAYCGAWAILARVSMRSVAIELLSVISNEDEDDEDDDDDDAFAREVLGVVG